MRRSRNRDQGQSRTGDRPFRHACHNPSSRIGTRTCTSEPTFPGRRCRFAGDDGVPRGGGQGLKKVKKGAKTVAATGDFNTDAYGNYSPASYGILTKYFTDSWNVEKDGQGLSCCQNAELTNPVSENDLRIDFVLTHGKVTAQSSRTTNVTPFRASPAPLWESDHAGVVAKLKLR